eukprot:Gregarina_sp_Poly_1__1649@NODE_141_length_12988_cov_478_019271_g126_i0_p8_GENE_NODE_141_length_12988_cov_478_019271_g126_i0NODE_141_length_12988_cov_478_019271_g126_i0_p8_ORF_typecomplete_len164_score18_30_NODE_141_length_12988_cov_478_019271_g126_i01197212463
MSKASQLEDGGLAKLLHSPILDCDCFDCETFFAMGSPKTASHQSQCTGGSRPPPGGTYPLSAIPPCLALNASGTSMTCDCATCREAMPHMCRWTAVAMHSSCRSAGATLIVRKRRPALLASARTPPLAMGSDSSDTSHAAPGAPRHPHRRNLLRFVVKRSQRS